MHQERDINSPGQVDRLHEEHDEVEKSGDEDVPGVLLVPLLPVLLLLRRVLEPVGQTRHALTPAAPLSESYMRVKRYDYVSEVFRCEEFDSTNGKPLEKFSYNKKIKSHNRYRYFYTKIKNKTIIRLNFKF